MRGMIQVPDGWEVKKLGEIAKFKGGDGFSEEYQGLTSGDFPFLKVSDLSLLRNEKYIKEANNYVDQSTKESLKYTVFPAYTIVFAKVGAALLLNRRRILTKNSIIDNNMMGMTVKNNFSLDYLYFVMLSIDFADFVQTGALPSINQETISNVSILIPKEKKEQEKIAKILSTLDKAIESTNRLIEKEKNIKTALMQELLTNGIDKNGQIRSPQTHTYKQSELGLIPDEWEVVNLGKCISNNGDYGINAPAVDFSYSLPTYLRITDIDEDGHFIDCNKKSVDDLESADYFLYDGDIVFARTGNTTGKTYLYNPKDGKLVFAGFLIRFTPNSRKLIPQYLKAVTETSNYWAWVETNSARTGQPGINANEYKRFKFTLPAIEEQKQIAKILTTQDKKIQIEKTNLAKLKELKKGLMNDLLSGKVRVKI